jgi:AcrR family transcriptional regulator
MKSSMTVQRQRRADGERTYQAIVRASAELATTEGLHGLSIARLADHVGISKSGLYAHFRSKEELQLATIEAAGEIFEEEVVRPTEGERTARGTLEALCERFFSHVERRVFPGGCFFAAASAEVDTHKGRVRDRISEFMLGWIDKLRELILAAQKEGSISPLEDPTQLAYELEAAMMLANNLFVLTNDPATLERGRRAIRRLLAHS